MNHNHFCVIDLETGSADPLKCQVTQISAIILNPRSLKPEPGGIFNSEVLPILDDMKAMALGFDPLEDEALRITNKTRAGLAAAPPEKFVWEKFCQFIYKFNLSKSVYKAPIPCGFNINNFDLKIIDRLCTKYGPAGIFNEVSKIDLYDLFFFFTESDPSLENRKLGTMMTWLGMPEHLKEGAHDALVDVKNAANILIKLLTFQRDIVRNNDYSKAFGGGKLYIE